MKDLEILHYHTENNLPIEKELVFKLVPELFVHEINKLGFKDRQRFKKPRISYTRADGEMLEVDNVSDQLIANEVDALFEKSMAMEMYLLE
jgi:adenylate cyclase class IV